MSDLQQDEVTALGEWNSYKQLELRAFSMVFGATNEWLGWTVIGLRNALVEGITSLPSREAAHVIKLLRDAAVKRQMVDERKQASKTSTKKHVNFTSMLQWVIGHASLPDSAPPHSPQQSVIEHVPLDAIAVVEDENDEQDRAKDDQDDSVFDSIISELIAALRLSLETVQSLRARAAEGEITFSVASVGMLPTETPLTSPSTHFFPVSNIAVKEMMTDLNAAHLSQPELFTAASIGTILKPFERAVKAIDDCLDKRPSEDAMIVAR